MSNNTVNVSYELPKKAIAGEFYPGLRFGRSRNVVISDYPVEKLDSLLASLKEKGVTNISTVSTGAR